MGWVGKGVNPRWESKDLTVELTKVGLSILGKPEDGSTPKHGLFEHLAAKKPFQHHPNGLSIAVRRPPFQ